MLPAIIAALAPILIGETAKAVIGDGPTAEKVSTEVVALASKLSGIDIQSPTDAGNAVGVLRADPDKLAAWYHEQSQLTLELIKLDNEDRRDARARDREYLNNGRVNWRAAALVAIAVIGVISCVVALVVGGIDGDTAVGGFIISVGTLLAGKIGTAFDFEFGSSAGSQANERGPSRTR